ncbi:MAG: sodium/proline symporter PutP [Clostridia bacterium]|nr:sodium/proline symporter PutP [Clostridia bacterium]MBR6701545.1 sodium/proline symporter PutP [Clostridia bacterium]
MFNAQTIAFVMYFVLIVTIGIIFFLKTRNGNEKDYFLGGRSMGPWVTALSAQASDMSGWLLMGFPGSILAFGMGKVWIGIGLAVGTALNWILVAKRLRKFSSAANDSITLPQYLKNRFVNEGKALQIICAIIFLVCFTVYVASSFSAGAKVFHKVLPSLAEDKALIIFAVILISYTFLGGFKAVCWTDFFQGLMMLIALLAVPIIIVNNDSFSVEKITAGYLMQDGTTSVFNANPFSASWQDIVSGFGWGLGYFGMPHILVRFMSAKNAKTIKKSATIGIIWVVLSLGAAITIAILGRALYAEELLANGMQERIFIYCTELFPPFIAGLLLSAIIAAAMSTADSQLLVASSSFTSDIYKPVIRKNASDKEALWVGRIVVLIIAVVAYFIASSKSEAASGIMDLVENAWGGFGASFGPVIILSLFWRRLTYKGAVAGVVCGALTDILWLIFLSGKTGVYEIVPGFIVGFIAAVVVTLIDKDPPKEVLDLYDRASSAEYDG